MKALLEYLIELGEIIINVWHDNDLTDAEKRELIYEFMED